MFQLPQVNLNDILPIAGLALIAMLCVAALLVFGLLRSRIALLIAVVVGIVVAGPTLANALVNVVWALVPLGVVVAVGAVVVIWILHRNSELLGLVRDVVPRRSTLTPDPSPLQGEGKKLTSGTVVINQEQQQPARKTTTMVMRDGDRWGF